MIIAALGRITLPSITPPLTSSPPTGWGRDPLASHISVGADYILRALLWKARPDRRLVCELHP